MSRTIATVSRLFVYPVKSMAGAPVEQAHVGFDGILGDRCYAFIRGDQAATNSFPWMTARQSVRMLLYKPAFDAPPTPEKAEPAVHVRTPDGAVRPVTDPALRDEIAAQLQQPVFLLRSTRGMFDCQHVSIFNLATVSALAEESGAQIDPRQFRANIYIEPESRKAFDEEKWAGSLLRVGADVVLGVTQRDSRCMMINLNPDTVSQDPRVLRTVAQQHQSQVGIYANVVRTGTIKVGDKIELQSED